MPEVHHIQKKFNFEKPEGFKFDAHQFGDAYQGEIARVASDSLKKVGLQLQAQQQRATKLFASVDTGLLALSKNLVHQSQLLESITQASSIEALSALCSKHNLLYLAGYSLDESKQFVMSSLLRKLAGKMRRFKQEAMAQENHLLDLLTEQHAEMLALAERCSADEVEVDFPTWEELKIELECLMAMFDLTNQDEVNLRADILTKLQQLEVSSAEDKEKVFSLKDFMAEALSKWRVQHA